MYFPRLALLVVISAGIACGARTAPGAPPSGTGESAPPQTRLTPANLEALMQTIGPGYQALQDHLQSANAAEAADEARQLSERFGDVEKFWAQRNRDDAVKWAGTARTLASDAAGAAATGDVRKAAAAATRLGEACKQCHGTHRESDGQGGYRIRAGGVSAGAGEEQKSRISVHSSRSTTIGSTRVARRAGR
jgi:cytochrome c556